MKLSEFIKSLGYRQVPSNYRDRIEMWKSWYKGDVEKFHHYTVYNGEKSYGCRRATLNMGKQACEYWADLLWNSECVITIEDDKGNAQKDAQEVLSTVLDANDFSHNTNKLTEIAFALGTGAYVIYPKVATATTREDGTTSMSTHLPEDVQIDYLSAEYIEPLEWYNGEIISMAGVSQLEDDRGNKIIYIMLMTKTYGEERNKGLYKVQNRYFKNEKRKVKGAKTKDVSAMESSVDKIANELVDLVEIDAPENEDTIPEYYCNYKPFGIIKPNIVNNIDSNQPMGLSIYGNSTDKLEAIDLAFDGMNTAMKTGRPRIAVSPAVLKKDTTGLSDDGFKFDSNDSVFYYFPTDQWADEPETLIKDITTKYVASDFEQSLQNALMIFSQGVGLGENSFKWDKGSIATATQVISNNSAMLRTMEKHHEGLRVAIVDMVCAVMGVLNIEIEPRNVKVKFDDSVTRDREAERQRAWVWVQNGEYPFSEYLVEYENYTEDKAKEIEEKSRILKQNNAPFGDLFNQNKGDE